MIELLFAGFLFLLVIVVANVVVARQRPAEQRLFNWLLFLLNLPVMFMGLVLALLPPEFMAEAFTAAGVPPLDLRPLGFVLMAAALWALLVAIPPVRRWLALWLPFDPTSPVHTLALQLSGYLMAQGALAVTQGGLSWLAESVEPVTAGVIVVQALLFAGLAIVGVGWPVRRSAAATFERLGLERPPLRHWLVGLGLIVVLVVLQFVTGLIWAAINPEQSAALEDVSVALLGDIDEWWEWLLIALGAGIGEELLFRGALQPAFGLGFTAVVFGLVHVQYGLTPITLFVIFLAVILGLIRRIYSTTIAMFVHAGYNFALGLSVLLAAWLEQFVGNGV